MAKKRKKRKIKKDIIEAIVEFSLVHPYNRSQEVLLDMVNKWGMRLISMGTFTEIAVVGIQKEKFKTMFKYNPYVGEHEVPGNAKSFISSIRVTKINILKGKK